MPPPLQARAALPMVESLGVAVRVRRKNTATVTATLTADV
jgi:hypothetical protein